MTEATNTETPELGQPTQDGVYAGLTPDGTQRIYAMPTDLSVTMDFSDAVKGVKKLNAENALGHNDWQISSLDAMRVLQENQSKGSLKGTFKTEPAWDGSDKYAEWYWSSTPYRGLTIDVDGVCFPSGDVDGYGKGNCHLSCRPVRLVAAPL